MKWMLSLALSGFLVLGCGDNSSGTSGPSKGDTASSDTKYRFNTDTGDKKVCQPGEKACEGNAQVECLSDGSGWGDPVGCPDGTVCTEGTCTPCQPEQVLCQGNTVIQCSEDGKSAKVVEVCPDGKECSNGVCVVCTPGQRECRVGSDGVAQEVWMCMTVGATEAEWKLQQVCPESTDCISGLCINPCQSDIKLNTNQGCDYYAVDLENSDEKGISGTLSAENSQFAVIVSNPSATKALTVTVHESQLATATVTEQLAPQGLSVIKLGPRNITGSLKGNYAWRIKGDHPFVAYQFNPLDNENPVFSNDASLLLPVNALDSEYLVMTGTGGGAFVTVVATKSNTEVTVTVTAATQSGGDIPALSKGESFTTTLDASEVLNLKAVENDVIPENLTGTLVKATKNVAVFSGNVATITSNRCCADHLEQQMFPTSAWGTHFICAKSQPRQAEKDHWRIMARDDGTNVTFSGGITDQKILNRGKYIDFSSDQDFLIKADKPILVGQFLASSFEILPDGVFCTINSQCASGVCAGAGNGVGRCMDTCNAGQSSCGQNEVCIDNSLMGDTAPSGGSCFPRPCGSGMPGCPSQSTCLEDPLDPTVVGLCYGTCAGFGGMCANTANECISTIAFGYLCAPYPCSSSGQCPGGWCSPPSPDNPLGQGSCMRNCTPQSNCPNPNSACLPAGLSADPTVKVGLCIPPSCASDADCQSGHTCVQSGNSSSCEPIGDPAFILSVPVEQFRAEYTILAPNAYKEDYINIIAPTDAFVQLDGKDVPAASFKTVLGTDFMVARIAVSDGAHSIKATKPVGIIVYGYHDDVSYGYPGGANLFDLGK